MIRSWLARSCSPSGKQRIALAAVDLVGLQYPEVKSIRTKLPHLDYVMVSSTHNHEGPDVIGIWGRHPFHRGVDPAYLDLVVSRVVQAIEQAEKNLQPVTAAFGTAEDESLVGDSRKPIVKDGVIRVVKLNKPKQWRPSWADRRVELPPGIARLEEQAADR